MTALRSLSRRAAWLLSRLLPASLLLRLRERRYLAALRHATDSEPELAIVRALIDAGDRCVDLGANFGVYTVAMSRMVGPAGLVVSVEPVAETYGLLTRNLEQLGITNARTIRAAVSDDDGEVAMEVPRWDYGAPNFYQAHVAEAGSVEAAQRVAARRLDTILADVPRPVSFIKCDVEGHELSVLRGATATLEQGPAWLIEVSGDPDDPSSTAAQVVATLAHAGYDVYRLSDGRLSPRVRGDSFINYFFLKSAHVERLRHAGLIRAADPA